MKRVLVLVVLAAFLVSAVSVFAEYNKEATVKAMRENLAGLNKARQRREQATTTPRRTA